MVIFLPRKLLVSTFEVARFAYYNSTGSRRGSRCWKMMNIQTQLRVARATDRIEEVVRFYVEGLGLGTLGSFENHEGFDGLMIGTPDAPYHLEFTHRRGDIVGRAPSKENLLVFYLPEQGEWRSAIDRMETAGYKSVPSLNPYWDLDGRTFEDPDGYRVVLQNARWPA